MPTILCTDLLFPEAEDFGRIINDLLGVLKELGDNVETQKMAAIGTTNLLKSITKEREFEQAKLQVCRQLLYWLNLINNNLLL